MHFIRLSIPRIVKDKLKDSPIGLLSSIFKELRFFRGNRFYGQTAEDAILQKLLPQTNGFYIDIGAGKPKSGSNTQIFYLRGGWHGILIDPIPRNARILRLLRPKDLVLETLVGSGIGPINFWEFDPYEYSTVVQSVADRVLLIDGVRLKSVSQVSICSLEEVTKNFEFLTPTLLSIDCEGFDLEVLESNDWNRFRPTVICVEEWDFKFGAEEGQIGAYLHNLNYKRFAFTGLSSIFVDKSNLFGVGLNI
jgi:FkbM family methyltransferase